MKRSTKQVIDSNWQFEKRGPKLPGLKEIKPSNSLYTRVLSFCFYRLSRITHKPTSRETAEIRVLITQPEISLRRHHCKGEDSIRILDFLVAIPCVANIQEMSEATAFVTVLSFLSELALSQCDGMVGMMLWKKGEITSLPEAMQYLLANYVQSKNITKVVPDVRDTRQKS